MTHPLEATRDRLMTLEPDIAPMLVMRRDTAPGWLSAAELTAADAPHLAELLARVSAQLGATNRRAPAALWMGHHAFLLMALPIAAYFIEQRVPQMALNELWLRFDARGEVETLAWEGRRFAALPADPAAGHPDCEVVAPEVLPARLREQVVGYFEALAPAVRARSSLGLPGLWALVADYFASNFTWAAGLVGPEAAGAAAVKQVAEPSPRLRRSRDFIVVEHAGRSFHLIDRLSCCLVYTVRPGEYCTSCPHRSRASKIDMIQRRLAAQAAQDAAES